MTHPDHFRIVIDSMRSISPPIEELDEIVAALEVCRTQHFRLLARCEALSAAVDDMEERYDALSLRGYLGYYE